MKKINFIRLLVLMLVLMTGINTVWAGGQGWVDNSTDHGIYLNYTLNGVAQVQDGDWGSSGDTHDFGTLTSDLVFNKIYFKVWWYDWDPTVSAQIVYSKDGGTTQYPTACNYLVSKGGNNREVQYGSNAVWDYTIASVTENSGEHTISYDWKVYMSAVTLNRGTRYFTYTILPPDVSGFTITPSGAGFLSGTGTEDDPYIMKHDAGDLVLTISGSQEHPDANSSAQYYNGSSWTTTATKTIAYASGSTEKQSVTLKMQYKHNSLELTGTESSTTVYYQRENAYAAKATVADGHGTVTPTTNTTMGDHSGGNITASASTGYEFNQWTITSGSGYFGATGTSTTSSTANTKFRPTANNTVVDADFDAIVYSITYNNMEDATHSNPTSYTIESSTITLTDPSLTGGYFKGWYTDEDFNSAVSTPAIAAGSTGNKTYYAKWMRITDWTFSPDQTSFAAYTDITLTPTIANTDDVDYVRCYTLYDADENYIARQPEFEDNGDGSVTFMIDAAGSYKVKLELKPADGNCESGTLAYGFTDEFTIETNNVVTVSYQSDGVDLANPTYLHVSASGLTEEITAPSIDYYSFHHWELGSNVTCTVGNTGNSSTQGDATITISASTNGKVTAVYKTDGIFFKNTLGWENVYICLDAYWSSDALGSGANNRTFNAMTKIKEDPTGDIYYCQTSITNGQYIAFLNANQQGYTNFTGSAEVVYRPINDATPMSIPVRKNSTDYKTINGANYIRSFWAKYNPVATGYTLKVYNQKTISGAQLLEEVAFEFVEDGMQIEAIANLESNKNLGFRFTQTRTGGADASKWQWWRDSGNNTMTYGNSTDWTFYDSNSDYNCGLDTKAAGDYKFIISSKEVSGNTQASVQGAYSVSVVYPCKDGDYRLVYREGKQTYSSPNTLRPIGWYHETDLISKGDGETTVQVYIDADATPSVTLQKYTIASNTWADVTPAITADLSGITGESGTGSGVYNFTVTQTNSGANVTISNAGKYTGKFYIRTDCVNDDKWDYKKSPEAHEMTYSSYSAGLTNNPFSHYFVKDVASGTNVRYTVATENSSTITDTLYNNDADFNLDSETVPAMANVRFMYNQETNRIKRAFIGASTALDFLNIRGLHTDAIGDKKLFKSWASNESYTSLNHASLQEHDDDSAYDVDTLKFQDDGNWVYEATVYAKPGAKIKLTAKYNTLDLQFFKGKRGDYTTSDNVETLLSGSGDNAYPMRIIYDFKINKLSTAWLPSTLGANLTINADVMLIRDHQKDAEQIRLNSYTLSGVKTVYGVMQINKWTVNNKSRKTGHAVLTGNNYLSQYERDLYWISFPFDVRLKEVFGFGTYGKQWIIEYYDGKGRAEHGFWADSEPNWKFVTSDMRENGGSDGNGYVLKANEGYILALDLDEMVETKTEVWAYNEMENVYLYFPSSGDIGSITTTNKDVEIDQVGYNCTINRQKDGEAYNVNKNRTIADSYWHCIGVPSYANYETNDVLTGATGTVIDWNTRSTPYLYVWDKTTNSLVATSSSKFAFKAMNSYLIQYSGEHIYWTSVANSAAPERHIAAQTTETPDVEYFLSLTRDGVFKDRTYIRLSDDENVTDAFEFNHDLSKEYNFGENIWTITTNGVQVAGNSMPKPLQTTVVPVGVKVVANGEYTLAMPEGTNGEDVFLIDNAYGTRTNLGLMPYTVTLTAGTYEGRFVLELCPIQDSPTSLENDANADADVRKVFVGGRLYIIRDGKVYDAAGQRVE
ncbi:MAG: InlB B-repeat-containing protein [Paludibacteraceae bacterium]|nr:InlB B-repeat-containing protein [Paludibacteraceae bacterium]